MRNAQYQVAVNLHGKVIRVREPDYGSWVGGFSGFSLLCVCGTVSETVTVIAGFDDVAMVGEAVEQRGGHLRVVEDPGPFTEGKGVVVVRTLRVRS